MKKHTLYVSTDIKLYHRQNESVVTESGARLPHPRAAWETLAKGTSGGDGMVSVLTVVPHSPHAHLPA